MITGPGKVLRQHHKLKRKGISVDQNLLQARLKAALPDGLADTEINLAHLLRACGDAKAIAKGRTVHHHIAINHAPDRYLGNLLIQMYGKCRVLEDARAVFDQMESRRNVYSWTLMMGAYTQHGHSLQALQLYQHMLDEGIKPDKITYICALGACCSMPNLQQGKEIHRSIAMSGFLSDEIVRNALLHMYGKCGSPEHAQILFDVDRQHVVPWNSMIGAYVEHGQCTEALLIYQQMFQEGVGPDKVTFISALSACSSLAALAQGKQIHSIIINCQFESDVVVGTSLIKMYDKCACVVEAQSVFDKMQHRDVVVWNSMLAAYAQHGNSREAFELYYEMKQQRVKPNGVTFISVLGACTSLADLAQGKDIHSHLEKCGFESHVIVGTALVNMYGKCEQLEDASRVFHKLNERNVVSWTAIIEVHAVHGQEKRALGFYKQMLADGVKPNTVTFVSVLGACTSLMDIVQGKEIHASIMDCGLESDVLVGTALVRMYGEFGEVGNAKMAFDKIHLRNVVSWTTMFTAYAQHGHAKEALVLYQQMQSEGVKPDKYLFINALEACSSLGVLKQGEEIHATIIDSGLESDVVVGTALIDMYGKCGGLEKAWSVLQKIDNRNVLSWTALIAGYAHAGHAEKALHLFEQMQEEDVMPDGVTFRSILSGCSHAGFVDEGWCHFYSMSEDYNIVPTLEHHACMVDLIGRAGRLEEAVKFILQIPLVPDVVLWSTLLGACRLHDDLEHGQWAAEKILQLDPQITAPYVLLSNICATDMKQEIILKLTNAMMKCCEEAARRQPKQWQSQQHMWL